MALRGNASFAGANDAEVRAKILIKTRMAADIYLGFARESANTQKHGVSGGTVALDNPGLAAAQRRKSSRSSAKG